MATKLKDGVFIGDAESSQDIEFMVANKIRSIINLCADRVPNTWERAGVAYLSFCWGEHARVLDSKDRVAFQIYDFVEEALENSESILIHSIHGVSRASAAATCYFMCKYHWSLKKTLSFMQSKRPDIEPEWTLHTQLEALDERLQKLARSSGQFSSPLLRKKLGTWEAPESAEEGWSSDEELLVHTFINSQPQEGIHSGSFGNGYSSSYGHGQRLSWIDDLTRSNIKDRPVPRSPFSMRPTVERSVPGASYNLIDAATTGGGGGGKDMHGTVIRP
eukprot:g1697.t1